MTQTWYFYSEVVIRQGYQVDACSLAQVGRKLNSLSLSDTECSVDRSALNQNRTQPMQ